ncbi:unnamed protein product [Meganyctiphanes norvegica]|uniref:Uncharacterized protein n=1 Tax=Meganyctiphanes norvegica TaxID=48144 RepID=A0AAV2R2N6_MEGNR
MIFSKINDIKIFHDFSLSHKKNKFLNIYIFLFQNLKKNVHAFYILKENIVNVCIFYEKFLLKSYINYHPFSIINLFNAFKRKIMEWTSPPHELFRPTLSYPF